MIAHESTLTKDRDSELAALWQIIIQNVDVIEKTETIRRAVSSVGIAEFVCSEIIFRL